MRDLSVVKQTRDNLRDEMRELLELREKAYKDGWRGFKDLGAFDRQVFSYMSNAIGMLQEQINTLGFVLNEDTELKNIDDILSPSLRDEGYESKDVKLYLKSKFNVGCNDECRCKCRCR